MEYKKLYEDLLVEHQKLIKLYNMLTPKQDNNTQDYIAWYIENYGNRPSSRLIEKFKELNKGGIVQ